MIRSPLQTFRRHPLSLLLAGFCATLRQPTHLAVAALLATTVSLLLPACSHRSNEELDAKTLHLYLVDDVKSLDPQCAYDSISNDVSYQITESLYQYDFLADGYKLVPLLAADAPSFSKDRLTLKIPLKKGILFQDDPCFTAPAGQPQGKGREVTAHDFVYGIKRLALPSLQSEGWWTVDNKIVGINAFRQKLISTPKKDIAKVFNEPIEGLKALDNYTLQIKLTRPYPQIAYMLSMNFFAPVPHEAVEKYQDDAGRISDHPVGTGPYQLKRWQRQHRLELIRNPNYHVQHFPVASSRSPHTKGTLNDAGKVLPFMDRLIFDVIKEDQPAWLNFMKGLLDYLILPKDNFQTAIVNRTNLSPEMTAKGIRLEIESGSSFFWITFNVQDTLLKNKFLRQALSSAIDRQKWIDTFTNGTGQKMTTLFPPGLLDRPKASRLKYDFDLVRAKELLKKAGYPDGKGLPAINFDLRGSDTYNRQLGEFFARQWEAIGVKTNVILNTFPAFLEKSKNNNLQVSFGGWNLDYPDVENVAQLLYGPNKAPGPNDANFDSPEMNRLYETLAKMDIGPARAAIVQKIDDLAQEECPWALGYFRTAYELVQPWVLNYRSKDVIPNRYKYMRVEPEIRKRYLEQK